MCEWQWKNCVMIIGCTRITGPSQIGTSSRDIFSQYNSDMLMIHDAMGAYYVFDYLVSFVISPIHYGNRNATISGRRTSTCTRVRVPLLQGRSALTTHYLPDTQNQTDDSSTYTPALLCLLLPASFTRQRRSNQDHRLANHSKFKQGWSPSVHPAAQIRFRAP